MRPTVSAVRNSPRTASWSLTEPQDPGASRGLLRPVFWTLVVGLIAFDLWSKAWAFENIGLGGGKEPIFGDWFSFYCITNSGGIWGMGNDGSVTTILTLVRLVAVAVLFWIVKRQEDHNRMGLFTLALLIAGAVGNLYDNLSAWMPWDLQVPGEVRDFLMFDVAAPGWWPGAIGWPFDPFPIFNFADACISVGFVLLITGLAKIKFGGEEGEGKEPSQG